MFVILMDTSEWSKTGILNLIISGVNGEINPCNKRVISEMEGNKKSNKLGRKLNVNKISIVNVSRNRI